MKIWAVVETHRGLPVCINLYPDQEEAERNANLSNAENFNARTRFTIVETEIGEWIKCH